MLGRFSHRLKLALALSVSSPFAAATANAAIYACHVKPTSVVTDNAGNLYLNGNVQPTGTWGWQRVCGVTTAALNVTVDACRNWTSAALTAEATGRSLFMFFESTQNGNRTDCSTFPAWNDAYITYLGPED